MEWARILAYITGTVARSMTSRPLPASRRNPLTVIDPSDGCRPWRPVTGVLRPSPGPRHPESGSVPARVSYQSKSRRARRKVRWR